MTCIVGYADKKNNVSWIGADSLASGPYNKELKNPSKVFRNETMKNIIMGGAGSIRNTDLLRYSEDLFEEVDFYKKTCIDHKFMVTKFIPKVIKLFKDGVVSENEKDRGSNFIVAVPGNVFEVQSDYSVIEPENGICVVGSGEDVAMGSLLTTKNLDMPIEEKIIKALEAAESYARGVQRPFRLLCTDGREEIIIT